MSGISLESPWGESDFRADGDVMATDRCGGRDALAPENCVHAVETEGFFYDGVEVGHLF